MGVPEENSFTAPCAILERGTAVMVTKVGMLYPAGGRKGVRRVDVGNSCFDRQPGHRRQECRAVAQVMRQIRDVLGSPRSTGRRLD